MPPETQTPSPQYRPSDYETDLKGLPGLLLFAKSAELVGNGRLPQELLDTPERYVPAMDHAGLTGSERAEVIQKAFSHASKEVSLSAQDLTAFGLRAANELRSLLGVGGKLRAIQEYLAGVKHGKQLAKAAYMIANTLNASPLLVIQEWLLFSEVGYSSPPSKRYQPTLQDYKKFFNVLATAYEPVGNIVYSGKILGLEGESEVNLAALASASLPTRQKQWLEHYFAWSIIHLPLQLGGASHVFDKPELARKGLQKLFDQGVNSHATFLAIIATCVRSVIEGGQKPQRVRFGQRYLRLGSEIRIVPCKDLPLCLFDIWLQRKVIASFASMLPGWDDVKLKGRSARDALDHEHQRVNLEEAYDLASCGNSPEQRAQINEMLTLCKAHLSDQQMELISLDLAGYSSKAIASVRGTNAAQVRQEKHRAVTKLRKMHGDQKKAVTRRH